MIQQMINQEWESPQSQGITCRGRTSCMTSPLTDRCCETHSCWAFPDFPTTTNQGFMRAKAKERMPGWFQTFVTSLALLIMSSLVGGWSESSVGWDLSCNCEKVTEDMVGFLQWQDWKYCKTTETRAVISATGVRASSAEGRYGECS